MRFLWFRKKKMEGLEPDRSPPQRVQQRAMAQKTESGAAAQHDGVAVYVRTTITTKAYDSYPSELVSFCRQHGWTNPRVYHDRVGGRADEAELYGIARSLGEALRGGKIDQKAINRLAEMSADADAHDRDNLKHLLSDIGRREFRIVVVRGLGQLGKSRMEAFRVLSTMMEKAEVHMPGIGRIDNNTQIPGAPEPEVWPNDGPL